MKARRNTIGNNLLPVSEEIRTLFHDQRTEIVAKATHQAFDKDDRISEDQLRMGFEFTTKALETAMRFSDLKILSNQISWGQARLPHDGIAPSQVLNNFQILSEVIDTVLSKPHAERVNQYLYWMIAEQTEKLKKND